ncbi:DUF1007 family protein [uncultured Tateyamaria sp.]|uniref:DUF1007 family protein n=1 Tax=Tateyamaria sp. 1078 TaxID=3417464 RepID=UPI0026382E65|nr:DUF1007 family protein [uncultured Tateyamaria sp.]
MRFLSALVIALLPGFAAAHPHVFVDTKIRVVVDNAGRLEGVEISWTYDDFYSLLLMSDMGLDNDGDGRLRDDELRRLDGFDMNWIEGYLGDTHATRDGSTVTLGPPQGRGVRVERGLITSTHFRAASGPADGLVVKAYDPTFYTAYSLVGAVEVEGPCAAQVVPADLDAAYSLVEELLYATPAAQAEDSYPEVGEAFADTVTVTCTS